jgi:hypothetical protein
LLKNIGRGRHSSLSYKERKFNDICKKIIGWNKHSSLFYRIDEEKVSNLLKIYCLGQTFWLILQFKKTNALAYFSKKKSFMTFAKNDWQG